MTHGLHPEERNRLLAEAQADDCDMLQCPYEKEAEALRQRIAELTEALRLIDGECEHQTGRRCMDDPYYRANADDWADRFCHPCIAHRALAGAPPSEKGPPK